MTEASTAAERSTLPSVAIVVNTFPSREHPYIVRWIEGLADAGIRLTVVAEHTPSGCGGVHTTSNGRPIEVIRFNSVRRPLSLITNMPLVCLRNLAAGALQRCFRAARRCGDSKRRALRKSLEYLFLAGRRFDLVHFNGSQLAVRLFELAEILGGRTVVSFRGQDFSHHEDRYDDVLARADHLHFISQHLVHKAMERGYRGGRHSLVFPMVDVDFFQPGPPTSVSGSEARRPLRMLTAARFEWVKGLGAALKAAAILKERGVDIEYSIAGDGRLDDAIRFHIHDLGLGDSVRLLGWLPSDALREALAETDVFVLTSVDEAFNNSVLQAQSMAVPVVCSDAGGLPENVADGVTGFVAKRRDPWDIADKIGRLAGDAQLRSRFGAAGRVRAEEYFSLAVGVQATVEMYTVVAHRDSAPGTAVGESAGDVTNP